MISKVGVQWGSARELGSDHETWQCTNTRKFGARWINTVNHSKWLVFGIKVQHHQLRLLCAISRPNGAHLRQSKVSQKHKNVTRRFSPALLARNQSSRRHLQILQTQVPPSRGWNHLHKCIFLLLILIPGFWQRLWLQLQLSIILYFELPAIYLLSNWSAIGLLRYTAEPEHINHSTTVLRLCS